MKHIRLLNSLLVCLGLGVTVHAEGTCPPGMYPNNPGSTSGVNGCNPIPGYQNQRPTVPLQPEWEDRFGAMYIDWAKGALGTSSDQPTRSSAEQSALSDCHARGGLNCKRLGSYGNSCASFVAGDAGYGFGGGSGLEGANQSAMQACQSSGNTNCRVYYADCSIPVRIW